MTERPHCARCRAPLVPEARFCGDCGEPTARLAAEKRLETARGMLRANLAIASLAVGFAGTLIAIVLQGLIVAGRDDSGLLALVSGLALQVAVGLAAARVLGRGVAAEVLRPFGALRHHLEAVPAAALALAASLLWVGLVNRLLAVETAPLPPGLWLVLDVVIAAPLVEEWLCRGVLWRSTREVAGRGTTLLVTAILFAMLHFLNGGSFLELPHRFVAGLLFGTLRLRSGSLWPGVLAHFLLNLAALLCA